MHSILYTFSVACFVLFGCRLLGIVRIFENDVQFLALLFGGFLFLVTGMWSEEVDAQEQDYNYIEREVRKARISMLKAAMGLFVGLILLMFAAYLKGVGERKKVYVLPLDTSHHSIFSGSTTGVPSGDGRNPITSSTHYAASKEL